MRDTWVILIAAVAIVLYLVFYGQLGAPSLAYDFGFSSQPYSGLDGSAATSPATPPTGHSTGTFPQSPTITNIGAPVGPARLVPPATSYIPPTNLGGIPAPPGPGTTSISRPSNVQPVRTAPAQPVVAPRPVTVQTFGGNYAQYNQYVASLNNCRRLGLCP